MTEKDYYQEGFDAYLNGKSFMDNPYEPFNDKRFDEWDSGYIAAENEYKD